LRSHGGMKKNSTATPLRLSLLGLNDIWQRFADDAAAAPVIWSGTPSNLTMTWCSPLQKYSLPL
jgi:hypothetical protein